MQTQSIPNIEAVERLRNGVVIRFSDGSCAFFSTALLYATLPEAQTLDEGATVW